MAETNNTILGNLTGDELVSQAYSLFDEWRSKYESEKSRLVANEKLYLGQHWEDMNSNDDIKPMTPIIHSTVENMSADLMDNFPQATITSETPDDEVVADIIAGVIRQNHDATNYRQEYHKACHDLLVGGWCVQEVGYDAQANHNLGGAFIRYVDNQNIMFDPQCSDIQLGRAVFKYQPQTIEYLEQKYPEYAGEFTQDSYTLETDKEVDYDDTKSVLMLEVWWKSWDETSESWKVHMAQMAGRKLLTDSRDEKPDGYFNMGMYPFVVTSLYRRKNSALGYGVPDMFGTMQKYADKMDSIVVKNAAMSSRNKLLNTHASGFDTNDLMDWSKDVHVGENLNGITWFQAAPLPQYIIGQGQSMRENIKDESGSNDFSRGNTSSGVTAASAIAALQELSSKRTRSIALLMQEAYKECVRYEIEFERDFNVLPREVLVTKDGQSNMYTFESAIMDRTTALGNEIPMEFIISIKVEKENRFVTTAHNELMLQMVQLGILQPAQALELMQFEGKESVIHKSQLQSEQVDPEMEQAQAEQAALDEEINALAQPEEILANQVG